MNSELLETLKNFCLRGTWNNERTIIHSSTLAQSVHLFGPGFLRLYSEGLVRDGASGTFQGYRPVSLRHRGFSAQCRVVLLAPSNSHSVLLLKARSRRCRGAPPVSSSWGELSGGEQMRIDVLLWPQLGRSFQPHAAGHFAPGATSVNDHW